MKTYLVPKDSFDFADIIFEFDAITTEAFNIDIDVDEYPTDVGGNIVAYAQAKPRSATVQGVISAWSLDGANPTKLEDAVNELFDFAKKGEALTLFCDFDAIDYFITKVNVKKESECVVEISFVEATEVQVKTTDLPPERLDKDVSRSGEANAQPTSQNAQDATKAEQSYAAKLYDFLI